MKELNLLNPERAQRLSEQTVLRTIVRTGSFLTAIVVANVVGLFMITTRLGSRLDSVKTELQQTQVVSPTGTSLPIQATTKRVNQRLNVVKPILDIEPLDRQLLAVVAVLPAEIVISQLNLSRTTGQLVIRGVAQTRSTIPDLQTRLEAAEFVESFTIASDINQRTDIEFTATVKLVKIQSTGGDAS